MIMYSINPVRNAMAITVRITKSFTIDPELDEYIQTTRGESSASQRLNELIKRAMLEEANERLEREAEQFFTKMAATGHGRAGTLAFQKAALHTLARD
jgi:hypothetical protein